ncbi:acyl-CoA dehydrogenase family protein [Mucilaginibacter xinganensis]|uniref:Acyl-CoA dehydrogenase n=1 Tax=Mucilaginibacter xinganensis TaxID=1234841 RepID=A0A223NSV1_9SPHI|nr:hypothetical protein [Mucilaginibacter xinganensis]ASU32591.1 Acyl-CoA dehydrogenase [Mucilaginibacter xinganensis]
MENTISHPSAFIEVEAVNTIRNNAPAAEQLGMLHPEQLQVIYKQQWFKLLVPEVYSGKQVTLLQLLQLQEAVSWADGSTGWVVTLCNGAGWFGGFIDPELSTGIFSDITVCLAGSGAVCGTAEINENGYKINGTWKYASGAHHATHITANCRITKNGETVLADDGEPLILPFIFDKKDVHILPAWKYMGMVATGSDAFEVKDLDVMPNRQFKIDSKAAVVKAPLYLYPFLQLAEATIAVNLSGMAIHFIDLCEDIFHEKIRQPRITNGQRTFLITELNRIKNELDVLRVDFFETATQSWEAVQSVGSIPQELLDQVSMVSRKLAHFSREGIDQLYPLCGLAAAAAGSEINRAWRDLHTASQHALITFGFSQS